MAIADHIGVTPTTMCQTVVSGLSTLRFESNSGVLKTLKRFIGTEAEEKDITAHCTRGLPAMLVGHSYGRADGIATNRGTIKQPITVSIICVCGELESRQDRAAKQAYTSAFNIGIEDLMDLAMYYGARSINGLSGIVLMSINQRWVSFRAKNYVAAVDLVVKRDFNFYDDTPNETFDSLGIVHNPTDYDDLWEVDNVTPKSEYPDTTDGGVADLT